MLRSWYQQARLTAFILSGGRSSRFGSDKARVLVDGEPLIRHVYASLIPIAASVTVVADRADKYADLGLWTIRDAYPSLGPLGGIHTALNSMNEPGWCLVVACDWYGLTPDVYRPLVRATREVNKVRAIAYYDGCWQPLLATYHTSAVQMVESALLSGQLSLCSLLDRIDAMRIASTSAFHKIIQVNTQQDLARCYGPRLC